MRKRNEALAQAVIKGLQSRNMTGHYAENKEEALEKGNYHYLDRDKMDAREGLLAAYDADIFLSSAMKRARNVAAPANAQRFPVVPMSAIRKGNPLREMDRQDWCVLHGSSPSRFLHRVPCWIAGVLVKLSV